MKLHIPEFSIHDGHLCDEQDAYEMLVEDDIIFEEGVPVLALEAAVTNTSAILIETIVEEQSSDKFCLKIKTKVDNGRTKRYRFDERGLLVRISPIDSSVQIVVPEKLRARVLYLAHYPKTSGHPGGTRLFSTLRREFYRPSMALDCYSAVRSCTACAKERIGLRKHKSYLKTFMATAPLEYVAIDILGPLKKTKEGNEYLLVISD